MARQKDALQKLNRMELLELLLEAVQENERLATEIEALSANAPIPGADIAAIDSANAAVEAALTQAKEEAAAIVAAAQSQRDSLLTDAQSQGNALLADAQARGNALINEAQTKCGELLAGAKEEYERYVAAANAEHDKLMASIQEERSKLAAQATSNVDVDQLLADARKAATESFAQQAGKVSDLLGEIIAQIG